MRKKLGIAAGVLVAYGSVWGGAYAMSFYTFDVWWGLPLFFTIIGGVCGGVAIVVHAAVKPSA